jgi:hypothetical protein
MAKTNNDSFYTSQEEHLEQGDIFRVEIVAPAADEVQRIFRTKDGRHGSVVFEENCDARVFSRTELDSLLESISQTPLHTEPFSKSPDGQEEMVVVFSRLFRFFIIATQTCDICGIDKTPSEWATVFPVITLADLCKNEPLPFSRTNQVLTIHGFVHKYCEGIEGLEDLSDMDYVPELKKIINQCSKSHPSKDVQQDGRHIRSYLSDYHKPVFIFSLPADASFGLPESYVDFTSAFTVPTSKLLALKDSRFAKIADPYRIDFAQKFGSFFSRVALPKQMQP